MLLNSVPKFSHYAQITYALLYPVMLHKFMMVKLTSPKITIDMVKISLNTYVIGTGPSGNQDVKRLLIIHAWIISRKQMLRHFPHYTYLKCKGMYLCWYLADISYISY